MCRLILHPNTISLVPLDFTHKYNKSCATWFYTQIQQSTLYLLLHYCLKHQQKSLLLKSNISRWTKLNYCHAIATSRIFVFVVIFVLKPLTLLHSSLICWSLIKFYNITCQHSEWLHSSCFSLQRFPNCGAFCCDDI